MNVLKLLIGISLITILSRIFGFTRDVIIAKVFGAEVSTDAFFIAFKLPNFLRRIFAEGAFSQAFIPILTEYKNKNSKEATCAFVSRITGLLMLILAIITILGILTAPWIIAVTVPGFSNDTDQFILTTNLLRIIFPYIFLISLASLAGAILNTWNYFSVPALTPTLLNISIISFSLFGAKYFHPPVLVLAWGVITGGVLQITFQLPFLKKIGMLVFPRISMHNTGVIRVIKKMGPAILGGSASQISLIINTIFSSFLVSSSVSWMYYADRLIELPSSILGITISTILLPSLAKNFSIGNYDEYSRLIDWGLRLCFLLALPSAIILGIFSKPLIISLFQYGKFTAFDVLMTHHALISYSIGLIGIITVKVLAPGFYSQQNIKTPAKITGITLVITQLMNLIFIVPLKHVGLSLSIGLSSYVNAGLLYWQLRKKNIFTPQPGWRIFFIQLMIAGLMMVAVLLSIMHAIPEWSIGNMPYRLLRVSMVLFIGIMVYFVTLIALNYKIKELAFWKA